MGDAVGMDEDDARKLSLPEQHECRQQVSRAYKQGQTRAQVARRHINTKHQYGNLSVTNVRSN